MNTKVFTVSAFTKDGQGGNPAGVVLNAEHLSNAQKQAIAKEVGFSETAFVESSAVADFKVRFFTPNAEVDLCGHATIATYSVLQAEAGLQSGEYTQELKAGILKVNVEGDKTVTMDQVLPVFRETVPVEIASKILNISPDIVEATGLSPQIVSTGLFDVFVPIVDREQLHKIKPDFAKMADYNRETNTVGFHVFTLDVLDSANSAAHCRNFCPLYEIEEEAATGSSNGALACYLFANGKFSAKEARMGKYFEQGYSMNNPSAIFVKLASEGGAVTRVQVGGSAKITGSILIS